MSNTKASWLMVALIFGLQGNASFAADWHSVDSGRELSFTVVFEGAEATGWFQNFAVRMKIDPEGHADSFLVTVDVPSATMNSEEIDSGMASPEWFDSAQFPLASFGSNTVRRDGQDFIAEGVLTLKGISQNISVPIHWEEQQEQARISGELTLSRMDFNIGRGEWQDETVIAHSVRVRFRVLLEPDH